MQSNQPSQPRQPRILPSRIELFQAENKTPNTFGYAQLRSIVDYLKEQTALPTLTLTVTQQVCPMY